MPSPEKGDDEGIGSDTDDELFAGFRPATNVPSEPVSEFLLVENAQLTQSRLVCESYKEGAKSLL